MNKKHIKLEQILETSLSVFAKYGFKKTTMEDIAKELDMSPGNLYFYVKSKKELYDKSVFYEMTKWSDYRIKALNGKKDIVEQIISYAEAGFEYVSKNKDFRSILINDKNLLTGTMGINHVAIWTGGSPEEFSYIDPPIKKMLKDGIRQKRFRDVNVDIISDLLIKIYNMFIKQILVMPEGISTREMTKEIVNLVLYGLVNDKSTFP